MGRPTLEAAHDPVDIAPFFRSRRVGCAERVRQLALRRAGGAFSCVAFEPLPGSSVERRNLLRQVSLRRRAGLGALVGASQPLSDGRAFAHDPATPLLRAGGSPWRTSQRPKRRSSFRLPLTMYAFAPDLFSSPRMRVIVGRVRPSTK